MRIAVNVTNNRVCRILERFTPTHNPFYRDYLVQYADRETRVVRERHMRQPMTGEVRAFTNQILIH